MLLSTLPSQSAGVTSRPISSQTNGLTSSGQNMTSSHHRPASHNPWSQDKHKLTVVQSVAQNEYGRSTDNVAGEHKLEYGKRSPSSNEFGEYGSNGLEMESYTSKEPRRRRRNPWSQDNDKQTVAESEVQNEFDPTTGDDAGQSKFKYGNSSISSNDCGKHGSNGLEMENYTSKEPRRRRKVESNPDRNKNGGSLSDLDDQTFNAGHKYIVNDIVQIPITPPSTEFHGSSGKPLGSDVASNACKELTYSTLSDYVDHRDVPLPLKYQTKQRPNLLEDPEYTTKKKSTENSHKDNINECSFLNDDSDGGDLEEKNSSATIQLKKSSSTKIAVQSGLSVERPHSMCASIDQAYEQVRSRGNLCSKPLPPLPQSEDDENKSFRVFSSDARHGKNAQSGISNQAPVRKTPVRTHKLIQPIQAGEEIKSAVPFPQVQRRQNSAVVISETHPALRGDPAAIQRSTPEKDDLDRLPASLIARISLDQPQWGPEMRVRVREVKAAHVQAARVQPAPVQPTPVQAAPVQAAPVQPTPVQAAPVRPSQLRSGSIGPPPVQAAPVPPAHEQAAHAEVEAARAQIQAARVRNRNRRQAARVHAAQVLAANVQAPNISPITGLSSSNTLVEPSNDRGRLGPAIEPAALMNPRFKEQRDAEKPTAIVAAVAAYFMKRNALYLFQTPAYRVVGNESDSSVDSQAADTRPLPPGSGLNTRIIDVPTSSTPTTDLPQDVAFAHGAHTTYNKCSLIKIAERLGLEALKDGVDIRKVHENKEEEDRKKRQAEENLKKEIVTVGTRVLKASMGHEGKALEVEETHPTKSKGRRAVSPFWGE